MKKFTLLVLVLFLALVLSACHKIDASPNVSASSDDQNQIEANQQTADKLEVYYFHGTKRCVSCLTIGEYINKTMMEYFSEEIADGRIDYMEVNIDFPENKDLARKFQASGSSLFINAIRGEDDDIQNVLEVWSLKSDENKFKSFLKQKIDNLLAK